MKTIVVLLLLSTIRCQFMPQFFRQQQLQPPKVNSVPFTFSRNPSGPTVEDSLDAGMAQNYLSNVPYLEHDTGDDCSPTPNITAFRPHIFQCEQDHSTLFTLHHAAVTNYTGDAHYPVSFTRPIRVFMDITSRAKRRFDNLSVEVSLFKRSTGWFGCGWLLIPSFSQMNTNNLCVDNPSCPLSPGRQVLEIQLHPERLFTRFFRMFHNDMSAYQMILRVRDNSRPFADFLCATIQTRISL